MANMLLIIPLALAVFWLWMLNDMLHNGNVPGNSPAVFRWPPEAKNHWILLFVVLNIFAAGYYYFTEYKK